ncbi:glycoside hydrolase family 16 protein, partial [Scleroderma citrinum Foug A]
MHALYAFLAAAIHLGTLAGAQKHPWSRHVARASPITTNKVYNIQDFYQGNDFFDQWSFYTGSDPTGGNVVYQSMQDAKSQGLAVVSSNNSIILAVDSTSAIPPGGNRPSVRITSNKSYNSGLFILDAAMMPVGCATWPAFWTVGPNWPYGGEIDIVEGINDQPTNQMTLHSGNNESCTIDTSSPTQYTGHTLGTNCYSTPNADAGCAFSDTDTRSFGFGFNNAGGGVFALLWDQSIGLAIWHFARSQIPSDLTNQAPNPSSWGVPGGFLSSKTCNIGNNFYQHSMVIDTTICGNWAGPNYPNSGCPGTCSDMVANAANFAGAKWTINYVAVY